MAHLLREFSDRVEPLTESASDGSKKLFIEGPFMLANQKNRNGRVYPKHILEKSVDEYKIDYLTAGRSIGELTHPDYPFPNIKEAAIMTKSLDWSGNSVLGKAQVLDNAMGNQIKCLLEAGFNLGVSTRGLGETVDHSDYVEVQPNFMLTAIDAVDKPSAQNCYVSGIREAEELEWIYEGDVWIQKKPISGKKPVVVTENENAVKIMSALNEFFSSVLTNKYK